MARPGEQVSLAEANLQYLIDDADRRAADERHAPDDGHPGPRRPVTKAVARPLRKP
jgi:hypothetical protein